MELGPTSTIRVLAVDDNYEDIRSYIADYPGAKQDGSKVIFGGRQLEFAYCGDLTQAFDKLRFADYDADVVLLDLQFSQDPQSRNGYWLLEGIREMSSDIGVLMMTQHYGEENAFRAGALRADQFVSKHRVIDRDEPEMYRELFGHLIHVHETKRGAHELHDRAHLALADPFAPTYDKEEQSYPATVAFYVFENEIIRSLVKTALNRLDSVRICDIGCGTGRIEELLVREFATDQDRITIDAVDFSGRMLARLRDKQLRPEGPGFAIRRGSAESLCMLPNQSCDVVLMAFGVPSYTKYHRSLAEAARICKSEGQALFSVYNEKSLFYDAQKERNWSPEIRPVAAAANPHTGKLEVGGRREFDCETFTSESFARLLSRTGFVAESARSFPTLHVTLSREEVARLPDAGATRPEFPHCSVFSETLYSLDLALSAAARDRGHYITVTARKA